MTYMKALIGRKLGMSMVFVGRKAVPVTLLSASPNIIAEVKTADKHGYSALKLQAFASESKSKKKAATATKTKEFRISDSQTQDFNPKDTLDLNQFEVGDKIDVTAVSKGKGFSGVIKKWGFHRGPETHGSDHHRAPGSIGSTFPQRVFPGKKMPGRYGSIQVTLRGVEVVHVDPARHLIALKGSVPGPNKTHVLLKANK
jgi:large subunit ribosomal protein L3